MQEFKEVKTQYVKEVIQILRRKADQEAKLLFSEFGNQVNKISLVDLSLEISREINLISDLLLEQFTAKADEVLKDPKFIEIIYNHCPPLMVEKYADRLLKKLPKAHKIAIIAKSIASHIVYREGLGFIQQIPETQRFEAIITYINQDQLTKDLVNAVNQSNIEHKEKITSILKLSAARDLTWIAMEKQSTEGKNRQRGE